MAVESATELPAHAYDEVRLLYASSVAEIACFKQQQWVVTNYVIAIQTAWVGFSHFGGLLISIHAQVILIPLVALTSVFGIWILFRLESSVAVRRERLRRCRQTFSQAFREAWSVPKSRDEVWALLAAAQVVAAGLAGWLISVHL